MIVFLLVVLSTLTCCDEQKLGPHNAEIAWDLHGVVLRKDRPRMALVGVKNVGIITADLFAALACESIKYCWAGEYGPTQKFIQDAWSHFKHSADPEAYKRAVEERDAALGRTITTVSRIEDIEGEFTIVPGMEELIVELSRLGYIQRIASNIGAGAYARLCTRYPFFNNHVREGQCIDFRIPETVRKPAAEFFARYNKLYNPTASKTIVFIDDNVVNVQAACQAGMLGILFLNPQQLRKDLKKLGVQIVL